MRGQLEQVAADIRRRANQVEPPFSTRQIVDVCFPSVLVTGARLPAGVDELVTLGGTGPTILYRRGLPTPDQRLAIAHALAHLMFDEFRPGTGCRPGNDSAAGAREDRADEFAMALLVPLEELRPYVGDRAARPANDTDVEVWLDMVDELASHFHVPSWVISRRLSLL